MIKNVHLGIFINEYNKTPHLYRDLKVFSDAVQLDQFMDYFNNNNKEVKLLFDEDISEYFLDNIPQIKAVEEASEKKFYGRLCAFYFDNNNMLQFLELPKPGKIIVRDYKKIPHMEKCIRFLWDLFEKTDKDIKKKYDKVPGGPPKGAYLGIMCEKFRQSSYEFSDEEVLDLKKYYDTPTEYNKKTCLRSIRTNVRRWFLLKAQEKYKEEAERLEQEEKERKANEEFERMHIVNHTYELVNEFTPKEEELLAYLDGANSELQYAIDKTNETKDYDNLYLGHDLDELIRDTNIGKGRK